MLEGPLRKAEAGNGDIPAQVRSAVVARADGLQILHQTLKKHEHTKVPTAREDKLRLVTKKALYPFRKETLAGLKAALERFQANLYSAVQVLNL